MGCSIASDYSLSTGSPTQRHFTADKIIISTLLLAIDFCHVSAEGLPSCLSFEIDYQDGGSCFLKDSRETYFAAQQSLAVCEKDVAQNFFIEPKSNEKLCNRTPDGTAQHIDCAGVEMHTGDGSILVISNKGAAERIVNQLNFHLTVGQVSEQHYHFANPMDHLLQHAAEPDGHHDQILQTE